MFAQASKRRLPHDLYRQSVSCLDGLQLPFLCPALFRPPSSSQYTSSITRPVSRERPGYSRSKASKRTTPNGLAQKRRLASAAVGEHVTQNDTYIPWESYGSKDYTYRQPFDGQSVARLPAFDPGSSPIIIKDSLSTHPRKFRAAAKDSVSGDLNEIHQTLRACLQVGRLERAATLVRRLNQIYKPHAPGLLAAHNDYVSELSHRIVQTKDQRLLQHLQRWFQVDLINTGVEADEITYAMMIHASLQRLDGNRDRTVRRYFDLAKEAGLGQETEAVLSSYDDIGLVRIYGSFEG